MMPRDPSRRVVRIERGERYSMAHLSCGHRAGVANDKHPKWLGCAACRRVQSKRQLALFPDHSK